MPEEKEILRYELDVTDVEAKLQKLQALLGELQAKRAAGQDTSAIEEELGRQTEAMTRSLGATEKTKSATDELSRSKEKLAQVAGALSGEFARSLGPIGALFELFQSGNTAVLGVGAGLAAVAAAASYYKSVADHAERAAAAQERMNAAVQAGQLAKLSGAEGIAEGLEAFGARSEGNVAAAVELRQRLLETWGVNQQRATGIAAVATASGLDAESAAVLNVLAGGGADVSTPEKARALLQNVRGSGEYAGLVATARSYATDVAGRTTRQMAMAPGVGGQPGQSPIDAAYAALKAQPGGFEASGLPGDLSMEGFRAIAEGGGDFNAIARYLYPGQQMLTRKEDVNRVRQYSEARADWLKPFVAQMGQVGLGEGGNFGPALLPSAGTDVDVRAIVEEIRRTNELLERGAMRVEQSNFGPVYLVNPPKSQIARNGASPLDIKVR